MKKFFLAAMALCLTFAFASCNKQKELAGTSWTAELHQSETMVEEGAEYLVGLDGTITLNFTDETNGETLMDVDISINGMTLMDMQDTTAFTYTFDGTNGTFSSKDEETGEIETQAFTYDKESNTITMTETDTDENGETQTYTFIFKENL